MREGVLARYVLGFLRDLGLVCLCEKNVPVLCRHALNAGTHSNLDHAGLDLVCNIDTSLQARRALPVKRPHGRRGREAGDQASGAHLGGTTAGGEDGADADIFDQAGVDLGAVDDALQGAGHEVGGLGVLEAALAAFCERRPQACRDDDVVGVLLQELRLAAGGGQRAGELAADLGESVYGWGSKLSASSEGRHGRFEATYLPS